MDFTRFKRLLARTAATSLTGVSVAACSSGLHFVNLTVPSGSYSLSADIPYGAQPRQKLDIYRPVSAETGVSSGQKPVVIFFYGGSWKNGERSQYRFIGEALTRRGFLVVVPDYRLYPEIRFPAFMEDAAKSVRWTRDSIARFGGDRSRIFIAGHSAGAHIAGLLAVDPRYLKAEGIEPKILCGVIGLAGPYAFDPLQFRSTRAVFGHLKDRDEARPIARLTGSAPPFLLLHGADDRTVLPQNSQAFADALHRQKSTATTEIIPETGHIGLLLSLARPFEGTSPIADRMAGFINAHCWSASAENTQVPP